jgi:RNA polymerase sigma-70 factor, ECF subfamily
MLRIQEGDQQALGDLLDRHARVVLAIGFRVLRDPGEAQELVQDVFLQLYRKSFLFDPARGTVRSWLARIAYHRAFDRREYLNLHRFYDHRNLDDFVETIQSATNLEYQSYLGQREGALRRAFDDLPEKQRSTLELYFFDGYTLREVSEHLGESLGNVRHYYYRGLERLKTSAEMAAVKDT